MERSLAAPALVLAVGLVAATCSSKTSISFDPGMCARFSACLSPDGSFGSTCTGFMEMIVEGNADGLGSMDRLATSHFDCFARAADCAAMKACFPPATPAQAALCTGTNLSACSGEINVSCEGTTTVAVDCAALGQRCIDETHAPGCGIAACDASTPMTCDGDRLVYCLGGALQSMSCAYYTDITGVTGNLVTQVANTCVVLDKFGHAQCVGSGPACDFQPRCNGTFIESCTGGNLARFDCAQYGLTCQQKADGSLVCGGIGTECDETTPESCDGGVITYCWAGTVTTLDCKQYGLSGCTTTAQSGSTWARCTE